MEMKENKELSEKRTLENNLELLIFSRFNHTAGDRCQVNFESRIDVDIKKKYFQDRALKGLDLNRVKSILGERTSYSYGKTRNFIAEDDKGKIFEELKQQFLENNLAYISSPSFPAKLIRRNYLLAEKKEMIRVQREAYLKNT